MKKRCGTKVGERPVAKVKWNKWGRLTGLVAVTAGVTVLGLKAAGADFSPLAGDQTYQQFLHVYSLISQSYYRPVDEQTLLNGATSGMVSALGDPFSAYMDPDMAARFRELVNSEFHGIGAVMSQNGGQLSINSVLPGSPAAKAGLKPGDILTAINGQSVADLSLEQAVERIRGKIGTRVTLTLLRAGKTWSVSVARARVVQSTVFAKMMPGGIGYVMIAQFSEGTAKAFARDLSILKEHGLRGLVIDVRDDPGGLLSSVSQIADDLLPKGAGIVQIVGRDGERQVLRSSGTGVGVPVVCLINGDSASAAEILAAALHESDHVPLVGERSYGKGTVQETAEFPDGSSLKLTIARWLTPDGQWIHKVGLAPTVRVPSPAYFHLPPIAVTDGRALTEGTNSLTVAVLQRMLLALGFNPGRTDGYYGNQTSAAVAAFQRMHSLPATGVVNGSTAYSINVAILSERQKQDPQLSVAVGMLESRLQK